MECDLDLLASYIVLALDTLSCNDNCLYVYQIILKSHDTEQSYGLGMKMFTYDLDLHASSIVLAWDNLSLS